MLPSRSSRRSAIARMGFFVGCAVVSGLSVAPGMANDSFEFRVDNEVFREKEKEPSYETLTVFTRGLAYDFRLTEPKQTTIFDARRGRINLLDPVRQLKCIVETDETVQFAARIKTMKFKSPLLEFAKNPAFEVNFIDAVGELRLNHDVMNYSAKGVKPKLVGAELEYRSFADASARLDAMHPGNLPPFPRLELNRILSSKGLLPVEIEKKVVSTKGTFGTTREEKVRSVHSFNWSISSQDRRLIEEADTNLVNFESCTFEKFFPAVAAANAAAAAAKPGVNR
jgi:hypothetical protein